MPQVSSQQRQLRSQVGARFVPAEEPEHSECVPQILKAWTAATTQMGNPCEIEHVTEGLIEAVRLQGLTPIRPGEKGTLWLAFADVRPERAARVENGGRLR